jgi:hypothetical protein
MIFWSRWWKARGLLIRKYPMVSLILCGNALCFHAFLLLLLSLLDSPFLSKVCFTDVGPSPLVLRLSDTNLFKFYYVPDKSSFFPVNFWVELSQPGVPQNNTILSQVGNVEPLSNLLFSSPYTENARFTDDSPLILCSVHVVHFAGTP